MVINIREAYLKKTIPPLTLQILVENAIKHNVISRARPLTVSVFVDEAGLLTVHNNYQKREEGVTSTGIGLRNLEGRYQFLTDQKTAFYLENDAYIAKVPLLTGSEEALWAHAEKRNTRP